MAARRRIASRRSWPDNLYLNSKGYYWFRNPADGKAFGLGKDFKLAAAQARAANAEIERRRGAVSLLDRISGVETLTLSAWCESYLNERSTGNRNTVSGLKSRIKAIREAESASKAIDQVTPRDIAEIVNKAIEERGNAQASRIRSVLTDVFRAAIEHGHIGVGKSPVDATVRPKHVVTRQRLTLGDFLEIRKVVSEDVGARWLLNAMDLALVTGQRREDIAALQFEQARDGFLWVEQAKTGAKLMIPLDLRLGAIGVSVSEVLKQCRDNVVSRHAIHSIAKAGTVKPGDPVNVDRISIAFARFREDAKIKIDEGKTPPSFHEIRSLAARLYGDERGAEFAQALLGHKSANMTALYRDSRGREWSEVKLGAA